MWKYKNALIRKQIQYIYIYIYTNWYKHHFNETTSDYFTTNIHNMSGHFMFHIRDDISPNELL